MSLRKPICFNFSVLSYNTKMRGIHDPLSDVPRRPERRDAPQFSAGPRAEVGHLRSRTSPLCRENKGHMANIAINRPLGNIRWKGVSCGWEKRQVAAPSTRRYQQKPYAALRGIEPWQWTFWFATLQRHLCLKVAVKLPLGRRAEFHLLDRLSSSPCSVQPTSCRSQPL
jgi:hypothetical protein